MSTRSPRDTRRPAPPAPPVAEPGEPADRDYIISLLDELASGRFDIFIDGTRAEQDPMLGAVNRLAESLRSTLGELVLGGTLVEKSAGSMHGTAKAVRDTSLQVAATLRDMRGASETLRQNMNSVSASSEELSVNMQSIAGSARQSSQNIDSIQASIAGLSEASSDIARNTANAMSISKDAMAEVTAAFNLVNELTTSAKDIDNVTTTISEISDQTKLLALNATIEAARAGEMGKGFAVVAKEVKDLASQTNTATKDIQAKIAIINEVTKRTVAAITTINGVMKSVNESITSIATAAEEQSATTADIAGNVRSATERIKEMGNSVAEGAVAIRDVSQVIAEATDIANQTARGVVGLDEFGQRIMSDAITSYAQALEVASHSGDIQRALSNVGLPEETRLEASEAEVRLCRFTQDYDVRVARMNEDHRQIFEYINNAHGMIKNKTSAERLLNTLRELEDFTRAHFAREEDVMARAAYPGLSGQKRAHEKLLKQVAEIIRNIETGAEVDLIATLQFFREWLIEHILGMDKKYGPHLNDRGIS